jgi:hypothetical protein
MRLDVEAGDRGVHGPNGCSRGGKVLSTTRWCAKGGMGRGRLRWEAARTRYGGAAARLGVQRLLLVDQALEQAFLLPDLDLDRLLLAQRLSFSVLSLASRLLRSSSTFRIRRCTRSKSDSPAAAPLMSAIVLTADAPLLSAIVLTVGGSGSNIRLTCSLPVQRSEGVLVLLGFP